MNGRALHHFLLLTHEEQRAAIKRMTLQGMALQGMGDSTIAAATGLSVSMVRQLIGESRELASESA